VVVLSRGILQALQVCSENLELLKNNGIPAHVLQTEAAVRLYNELAENQRAAGLLHSTCWEATVEPALCSCSALDDF
jgi:hypothetical protein